MPFRQPDISIIDADNVRAGAYSFRVEAWLAVGQSEGKLSVDASAGYLLTASDGKAPRRRINLDYVVQADGSRVAHDTLMLLRGNDAVTDGTVTLRDPIGETLVLRIIPGGADAASLQQPELLIDQPTLKLEKTYLGEESFAILNIGQRRASTPISVVVDNSEHFSIATGDNQLLFGPSVYFTPASSGTYIHVRYQPNRPGRHSANLFVETPYQIEKVRVTGRTVGFIPIQTSRPVAHDATRERPLLTAPVEPVRRQPRLGILALLLLGGLAYAGYVFRCEWAPSLCREPVVDRTASPTEVTPVDTLSTERPTMLDAETVQTNQGSARSDERETELAAEPSINRQRNEQNADERRANEPNEVPMTRRNRSTGRTETAMPSEPASVVQNRPAPTVEPNRSNLTRRTTDPADAPTAVERPAKRRATPPATTSEVSDLEQELNKKPGNNPQ